jgi:hypothetical protein
MFEPGSTATGMEAGTFSLSFCLPILRSLALLVFLLLCLDAPASAQTAAFGDIVVKVKSEPKGYATHGYSEYVFTVMNRSKEHTHAVTLIIPSEGLRGRNEDSIRSISRTVQAEPETTLQVSLLQPDYPPVAGDGLKVIIDGREQEPGVALAVASSPSGMGWAFGPGGRRRYFETKKRGGAESEALVLLSQRVGGNFHFEAPVLGPGVRVVDKNLVSSDEPINNWSSRWLSYSRYDGIVLTRDELEGPTASQAVRTALFQYVEAGGCLLVLDRGQLTLPRSWKRDPNPLNGFQVSRGGFGVCLHFDEPNFDTHDTSRWPAAALNQVMRSWSETAAPYQTDHGLAQANAGLPIVEDLGLPVRGLFVLMLVFTIAIGPCNIWLLSRWKRRIWLLWTVPVISLCTCTAVFGYMIVVEGWQGRTRVVGFTLLDENEQRAATLGRSACYSPLTPGDGLRFSQDTEVSVLGMDGGYGSSGASCDIDWTKDQHLQHGWLSARVPAQFQLRRSEVQRKERLPLTTEADGSLHVTNQLGASIRKLWLADKDGKIYTAEAIPEGQRAALSPLGKTLSARSVGDAYRVMYATNEWARLGKSAIEAMPMDPQKVLAPRTYLTVMESSPFLKPGLAGAVVRPTLSYVLGLMADE